MTITLRGHFVIPPNQTLMQVKLSSAQLRRELVDKRSELAKFPFLSNHLISHWLPPSIAHRPTSVHTWAVRGGDGRAAEASENGDPAQHQELSSAYIVPVPRSQPPTQ